MCVDDLALASVRGGAPKRAELLWQYGFHLAKVRSALPSVKHMKLGLPFNADEIAMAKKHLEDASKEALRLLERLGKHPTRSDRVG